MRILLDTHAFIWWDNAPSKLATTARSHCQSPGNTLLLSIISVWEMQIKLQIGKMTLPAPLMDIVNNQIKANQLELLPVALSHISALDNLPMHHKDPFDRMLVAQAITEGIPIISADPALMQYPVTMIWR